MEKNSLIRNVTRILSANFWIAIVGFLGSFIFPKIMDIDGYALYHTFTLYVGYVGIFHLGFPSGLAIKYAGKKYLEIDKEQYRSEIKLLYSILIFFVCISIVVSCITHDKMASYITFAILPVCITVSYKALLQAWNRFKEYSIISTIIATCIPLMAFLYYIIFNRIPGDVYICIYLLVYWGIALFLSLCDYRATRTSKSNKLFSKTNYECEKIGLALMMGNYVNVLFVSSDKQFIKCFYGTKEFAFYSFGMSMQALMTVFITSIAQPMFPAMARGKFKDEEYNSIKELLIVFGSFSGIAYFVTSIIVNNFIQKYAASLEIISIYFVVFPAMAVINCLYVNLYKIKYMMKTYILTLIFILITAIALNFLFIITFGHYTGVAIATTLTYYIWFIIGCFQFKFIHIKINDIIFLVIYLVGFFLITRSFSDYIGILVYLTFIVILAFLCYKNQLKKLLHKIHRFIH